MKRKKKTKVFLKIEKLNRYTIDKSLKFFFNLKVSICKTENSKKSNFFRINLVFLKNLLKEYLKSFQITSKLTYNFTILFEKIFKNPSVIYSFRILLNEIDLKETFL